MAATGVDEAANRGLAGEAFASVAAWAVAAGGLLYGALFAYLAFADSPAEFAAELWYATLALGAGLSVAVLVAVYQRVRLDDPILALWALLLGLAGSMGGILHGARNLALLVHPVGGVGVGDALDPRGILRYFAAGVSTMVFGWLFVRWRRFPRLLGYVGLFGGALLVLIYFGRLYRFITPRVDISLLPPLLFGLVVFPVWNFWIARELGRRAGRPAEPAPYADVG